MNTNITVSLDMRSKKKNGTYPLVLRLGHKARTTTIPLNISLQEKDWDAATKQIKKSYEGTSTISRLNNLIQKKRTEAMDIILRLHESGVLETLTLTEVRNKIDRHASSSFYSFTTLLITELKKSNRIGTAKSYKEVSDVIKKFCGKETLSFTEITYSFLTKLETAHLAKGNSPNGLAAYLRTLRAIYNKAINSGIVDKEYYPFNTYKIKTIPPDKRALDWELLKNIIDYTLTQDNPLFRARNYFLASYMMYGMTFTDMAFLGKSNLQNGRIYYRRTKTSKLYDIKVTPALDAILSFYITQSPDSPYVFPILKRDTLELQYKDIMWARKRYNMRLKTLANECGIESRLTSYVSRHSFATQAMLLDIPLNAISTMLGHSSLKTTQAYLKSLPSSILDVYNSKILQQF